MGRLSWVIATTVGWLALSTATAAASTTLRVGVLWSGPPQTRGFQNVAEAFERSHPGVKVELIYGVSEERFIVSLASQAAPDVYTVGDQSIKDFILAGYTADITDLFQKDASLRATDFLPPAWERVWYKGRVWGLPYSADPNFALFANKAHLAQAGVELPTTIPQLDEAIRKLTQYREGNRLQRLGMITWDIVGGLGNAAFTWSWAFGGSLYDAQNERITPTHPKVVQMFDWMAAFTQRYPRQQILTDLSGSTFERFARGTVAMVAGNPPSVGAVRVLAPDLEMALGVFPHDPGIENPMWIGGHTLFVVKGTRQRELAYQFVRFAAASQEGSPLLLVPAGYFPAYRRSPVYQQYSQDPALRVFIQLQQTARFYRGDIPALSVYNRALSDALLAVLEQRATSRQVLEDLERQVQPEVVKRLRQMTEG